MMNRVATITASCTTSTKKYCNGVAGEYPSRRTKLAML